MAENDMNIPVELQFRDVRKQNKVVISKQQRQILPQNGTNFTISDSGSNQIIFRIPNDENSSVDFSSAWIVCDIQIEGLTAANYTFNKTGATSGGSVSNLYNPNYADAAANNVAVCCIGDSIESIIQRVAIYVNGSELERLDYYNFAETAFNCHANNVNFSNSLGSGCMGMNLNFVDKSKMFLTGAPRGTSDAGVVEPLAAGGKTATVQFAFPLRYCGLMNSRSLIPSYLMGSGQSAVEIRIFLENVKNCLAAGILSSTTNTGVITFTADTSTSIKLNLSNVRMNIDYVQTSEEYSSALREYLTSNTLTVPLKTYYHTQFEIGANSKGWINNTISTQFSDVEAVYLAFFKGSEQNSLSYLGSDRLWVPVSADNTPCISQARLTINGLIYPSVPIYLPTNKGVGNQAAEAYQYLIKALSQNANLEILGSTNQPYEPTVIKIDSNTASGTAPATGNIIACSLSSGRGLFYGQNKDIFDDARVDASITPANTSVFANPERFFTSPSQFVLGFDVSKSSYGDDYTLSGSDLSKTSGLIQVQLLVENSPAESYNCLVVIQHKRLLEIGLDNAQVIY